jgi:hypothetical protein
MEIVCRTEVGDERARLRDLRGYDGERDSYFLLSFGNLDPSMNKIPPLTCSNSKKVHTKA